MIIKTVTKLASQKSHFSWKWLILWVRFWQKERTSITCFALRRNAMFFCLTKHLSQIMSFRQSAFTWQGSAAAMAWPAFRASWQTSSWAVMMRWVTMRLREQSRPWLNERAELTDSSQSAAAAGSSVTLRSTDRATLSSPYQGLRGSDRGGAGWGERDTFIC